VQDFLESKRSRVGSIQQPINGPDAAELVAASDIVERGIKTDVKEGERIPPVYFVQLQQDFQNRELERDC
jgi:hypothetical protein